MRIRNKKSFETWAVRNYGDKWYNEKSIIKTYGKKQLQELYGIDYASVPYAHAFNKNDIDYEKVKPRALNEAKEIMNSSQRDENRTDENIIRATIQGHYAEVFLIDKCGFSDCDLKYHDLVDPNGLITEVKTGCEEYLNQQYYRIKHSTWNQSERIIGFYVEDEDFYLYYDIKLGDDNE